MEYKGFELEIVYLPGSNFRIDKDNVISDRKPTKKDIDYVIVTSPDFSRYNEKSIKEAKQGIDEILKKYPKK